MTGIGDVSRLHPAACSFARRVTYLAALLAVSACAGPAQDATGTATSGFDFAVMGDTPYEEEAERLFPVLAEAISSAPVDFVVHVGDIKGGSAPCTDSILESRVRDLAAIRHPVVYVPGDNEWTDCHRQPPGTYAPLERLAFLRAQAYPTPGRTLGTPSMEVETQATAADPEFPEHQRWTRQGVVFATIHAVGSLNGLVPFPTRTAEDDTEADRRIVASVAWIRGTFAEARSRQAVAVVVATQADPWAVPANAVRTGFEEILATLREEAEAFGRPVLFIHGDTHQLRLDRPFWNQNASAPNLLRLETYGSPDVGWIQVHVDPGDRSPFSFTPRQILPR